MAGLTEAKKRDFIKQLVIMVTQNKQALIDKGFDPTARIDGLKVKSKEADAAEVKQQKAMVAYKDSTKLAQETLRSAYTDASGLVDILSGMLGKKDNLVLKIKKMRK